MFVQMIIQGCGHWPKQRALDLPLPGDCFYADLELFPGQQGDILPSMSWYYMGPTQNWIFPEKLTREASRRHPNQFPKPYFLSGEEQGLHSEPVPNDGASMSELIFQIIRFF